MGRQRVPTEALTHSRTSRPQHPLLLAVQASRPAAVGCAGLKTRCCWLCRCSGRSAVLARLSWLHRPGIRLWRVHAAPVKPPMTLSHSPRQLLPNTLSVMAKKFCTWLLDFRFSWKLCTWLLDIHYGWKFCTCSLTSVVAGSMHMAT